MKRLICLFMLLFLVSCSQYIDKPKNLVSKSTMSEIMADLAINDQIVYTYQNKNLESGTRFILKKYGIAPNDFVESYKYYVVKDKMTKIVENAQDILLEKDPKAADFVKNKSGKNKNLPQLVK